MTDHLCSCGCGDARPPSGVELGPCCLVIYVHSVGDRAVRKVGDYTQPPKRDPPEFGVCGDPQGAFPILGIGMRGGMDVQDSLASALLPPADTG